MSNLHRDQNEANKHTAKGFISGSNGSACIRNENGTQEFEKPYGFPSAINFVDGNAAPPTVAVGDIYVLIDLGNGALHPDWTTIPTVAYGDWVKRSVVWLPRKPIEGIICFNKANGSNYYYDGSDWVSIGASAGRFGITDTSGIFTYYSDFATAYAAATSGQKIFMFADGLITTTLTLKSVDIVGNGFEIQSNNVSGHAFQLISGTATVNWDNVTINQINSGIASSCLRVDAGATINYKGINVTFKNSSTSNCVYLVGALGSFDGFNCINLTGRGIESNIPIIKNGYAYGVIHGAKLTAVNGVVSNITGETTSGLGLRVDNTTVDFCNGIATTGTALSSLAWTSTFKNSNGKSISGVAGSSAYFENCSLESGTSFATDTAYVKNSTCISGSGTSAATCYEVSDSTVFSSSARGMTAAGGGIYTNNSIRTNSTISSHHAISGTVDNVLLSNNHLAVNAVGALPVRIVGTVRGGNNTGRNFADNTALLVFSGFETLLTVAEGKVSDAQNNLML